jgi:hypothetical protein
MQKMKVYIINYKESTLDENNVLNVECGTCETAYDNEDDAIRALGEVANGKLEDLKAEADVDNAPLPELNGDGDYLCVVRGSDTYEYMVYQVLV